MIHFLYFGQQQQRSWEPRQELASQLASRSGPSLPTMAQLTRIFAAFMCSLVMALSFLIFLNGPINDVVAAHPLLTLAEQVFFAGVICALGVVLFTGIPLAVVAWRSTPRIRFLLTAPFLALVLPLLTFMHPGIIAVDVFFFGYTILAAMIWRTTPRKSFLSIIPFLFFALLFLSIILTTLLPRILPDDFVGLLGTMVSNVLGYGLPIIGNLGNVIVGLIFYSIPVLSTIAINRAMREATLPEKWFRFARIPSRLVVFALLVMFLGLLFWGVYLVVFAPAMLFSLSSPLLPSNPWLLTLIGMLISVIVAVRALSSDR
jgi:hypothetical protein